MTHKYKIVFAQLFSESKIEINTPGPCFISLFSFLTYYSVYPRRNTSVLENLKISVKLIFSFLIVA